jgi:GTPase SAR1 family protein
VTSDRAAIPFKALLVEGTSGAGKSTLIDALIRRHIGASKPRKIRSLIHLAQSHTYGPLAPLEDRETLTVADNVRHLERIVGMLEWLHASVQEHQRPWCFVVIDTLHITHCVRPGMVKWADVAGIDERLAAIDCKLFLMTASAANIWKRGIEARRGSQFLEEYARKFGSSEEEIHQYFVREQETIGDLFSRSNLLKCQKSDEDTPEDIVNAVYKFWMDGAA